MFGPMLDLRYVVENRARVEELMARRGASVDARLWDLDGDRRRIILEVEGLRFKQRTAGEEIARLGRAKQDTSALKTEMKGVADRIKELETAQQAVDDN